MKPLRVVKKVRPSVRPSSTSSLVCRRSTSTPAALCVTTRDASFAWARAGEGPVVLITRSASLLRGTCAEAQGTPPQVRRKYRGYDISPHIGYGTRADLRHGKRCLSGHSVCRNEPPTCLVLPNGFKKFTINNVAELDLLLMQNRVYCAEIAHNVSQRKRAQVCLLS